MNRYTIMEYHDGSQKVITHGADANDASMVEYALKTFGNAHLIKRVILCTENITLNNESGLHTWLQATKRLTE